MTLPDCMMPDGAEPCVGYQELDEQVGVLVKTVMKIGAKRRDIEAENRKLRAILDFQGEPVEGPIDGIYWQLRERVSQLENLALKALTVVEWVVGEGRLLPEPHFDADDLLLEMVSALGVETSAEARARLKALEVSFNDPDFLDLAPDVEEKRATAVRQMQEIHARGETAQLICDGEVIGEIPPPGRAK